MPHSLFPFNCVFWFCLLIFSGVSGVAQEETKISCRFLCLEATAPPLLVCTSASGLEIECKVPSGSISKETTCYAASNTVTFLSKDDRKPAATAKIPANVTRAIFVFVSGPKTPDALPWRIFVIEDSTKNMPDGGAFVVNFHNQDIRCVVGEAKNQLRPAGSLGIPLPEKRDDFNMAPVAIQFQVGDAWRNASETMLRFLPGMRYLIFAYLDPASGRPKVNTFQDTKVTVPVQKAP